MNEAYFILFRSPSSSFSLEVLNIYTDDFTTGQETSKVETDLVRNLGRTYIQGLKITEENMLRS